MKAKVFFILNLICAVYWFSILISLLVGMYEPDKVSFGISVLIVILSFVQNAIMQWEALGR